MYSKSNDHREEPGTERKILEAAGKVFMMKGKDGASMQDIADEAGINRTLLHYYFRNKNKLFDAIFENLLSKAFPAMAAIFMSNLPLMDKFKLFAEQYTNLLKEKPYLLIFIFQEISLNPDRIVGLIRERGLDTSVTIPVIIHELKNMGISDMDPRHLIANLIGMVIFPFVGRPIFQKIAFNDDEEAYDRFLEERKKEIPRFMALALKGKPREQKRKSKSEFRNKTEKRKQKI
jgi:TetR/AcrR family transcriptional regulator